MHRFKLLSKSWASIAIICLLGFNITLFGASSDYKAPSGKEVEENCISPREFIADAKLQPGMSEYRKPLVLGKSYKDDPKAQKELTSLYELLDRVFKDNSTKEKQWCSPKTVLPLIDFIKKYSDTAQAVTAKLLLGRVLGDPWYGDTLPSHYWAIDLLRETYLQFPDKWQGKLALYYLYLYIFWPSPIVEPSWGNQFLDDFDRINYELEKMYLDQTKDESFKEYLKYMSFQTFPIHWTYVALAYCHGSMFRWSRENGVEQDLINKSKSVYQHMWDLCNGGKYCPMRKSELEELPKMKSPHSEEEDKCYPDAFK